MGGAWYPTLVSSKIILISCVIGNILRLRGRDTKKQNSFPNYTKIIRSEVDVR